MIHVLSSSWEGLEFCFMLVNLTLKIDLSSPSALLVQQFPARLLALWLSELKKRKMKGLRQEFDTMDTPMTELKVSHHDLEHLSLSVSKRK